eukprot:CAMPEP_0179026160 /NCGR_PEP_ID=MMETSP0796-20121207/8369_1 /TAXON_ID=73915 /ORGANISM="Pyrodinium bahamense, Strain pbaha01" /LENGTH=53 /DNA_ID=CAMNT_0020722227 /DNA_START=157 /DNA_END=318 /DNA_ORIENTATION=+
MDTSTKCRGVRQHADNLWHFAWHRFHLHAERHRLNIAQEVEEPSTWDLGLDTI